MKWINNKNKKIINMHLCTSIYIAKTYVSLDDTYKLTPLYKIIARFDSDENTIVLEEFFNEKEAETYIHNLFTKIKKNSI